MYLYVYVCMFCSLFLCYFLSFLRFFLSPVFPLPHSVNHLGMSAPFLNYWDILLFACIFPFEFAGGWGVCDWVGISVPFSSSMGGLQGSYGGGRCESFV